MLPYENLSLEDIENEQWKPVKDFEGLYEVSNMGRIKSLPRSASRHFIYAFTEYLIPERIMKQNVLKRYNTFTKQYYYKCYVRCQVGTLAKSYSVHRLVYETFIGGIDFKTDSLSVLHRLGNGLDNRLSNLYADTLSEKTKKNIRSGRIKSEIHKYKNSAETQERITAVHRKPVTQYTLDGKRVNTYASRTEAIKALRLSSASKISEVVNDHKRTAGGYRWIDGTGPEFFDFTQLPAD